MATVIIRPTSIATSAGFGHSTNTAAHSFDNDNATYAQQISSTAYMKYVLADLDAGLSGATINSYKISAYAKGGRAGAFSADLHLIDSSGQNVASPETETWGGSLSTQTTTAATTQYDGSALTYAYINGCLLYFDPNTQGAYLYEIYVTVDYTAAPSGYGHIVNGVAAASIGKVDGVATADIEKVIGV